MANNTIGFNYENADTDRFQDKKIKRLVKVHKGNGYAVWDFIKNEIYRVKGYYIEWDEDTAFDVADYWGIKESLVVEIVNYCCHVGLFKKELLTNERILTSAAIQIRFLKWSKMAKRKEAKILEKYRVFLEESPKIPEELNEEKRREVTRSEVKGSEDLSPAHDVVLSFFKEKSDWPEKKCLAEARKFIDHYGKTGWRTRNGPIVNWENAASGWISRDVEFDKKSEKKENLPDNFDKALFDKLFNAVPQQHSEYLNHLLKLGFVWEFTTDGRPLKMIKKI